MQGWERVRREREQNAENRRKSNIRTTAWSETWEVWTLQEAARHFPNDLGPSVFGFRTFTDDNAKVVYRNPHTGWLIRADMHNKYFTIHCPKLVNGQTAEMYVAKDGRVSLDGRGNGFHFKMPEQDS